MQLQPTLSVIIPNYNHGHYLKDLLPALFSQTRIPDEVVIVDDGSTDESVQVIEAFQRHEKRVQLFKNGINQGVNYSLNLALSKARGIFVTFPSADNFVLPTMYEKSLALLQKYPEAVLCCSDPMYCSESSQKTRCVMLNLSKSPVYFSSEEVIKLSHQKKLCLGNISHTILVKKQALLEVGFDQQYFIKGLGKYSDFFAWNAIAFRYGTCYLPEGFAILREAADTFSSKKIPWSETKKLYRTLLSVLDLSQNKDIKIAFKESNILEHLGYTFLLFLFLSPSYYQHFTSRFVVKLPYCAYLYSRSLIGKIPHVKKFYQFLRSHLKNQYK